MNNLDEILLDLYQKSVRWELTILAKCSSINKPEVDVDFPYVNDK